MFRAIAILLGVVVFLSGCGGVYAPKTKEINSACNGAGGITKVVRRSEQHKETIIVFYELTCRNGTQKVVLDE